MRLSAISLAITRIDRAGAAGFSPLSLFALGEQGAWYDPSDLSTMFQDSAGTTPVTADGQPVGLILDKSGNGNHASQATSTSRPLYRTDGTYHWLQFDGVDDGLSTAAINFTSTAKMSVFGGVRKTAGSGFQTLVELGSGGIENGFAVMAPSGNNNDYDFRLLSNGGNTTSTYPPPDTKVFSVAYDTATAVLADRVKARLNAAPVIITNSGTAIANFMSAPINIGRRNNASLPFNGNIYSLIVRGVQSGSQEIAETETWVNGKTGAY